MKSSFHLPNMYLRYTHYDDVINQFEFGCSMLSDTINVVSDKHVSSLKNLGISAKIGDILSRTDIKVAYKTSIEKFELQMGALKHSMGELSYEAERFKLSTSCLMLIYHDKSNAVPSNPNDTMFSLGTYSFIFGIIVEALNFQKDLSSLGTGLLAGGSALMAYSWFSRQNNTNVVANLPRGEQEHIARLGSES